MGCGYGFRSDRRTATSVVHGAARPATFLPTCTAPRQSLGSLVMVSVDTAHPSLPLSEWCHAALLQQGFRLGIWRKQRPAEGTAVSQLRGFPGSPLFSALRKPAVAAYKHI